MTPLGEILRDRMAISGPIPFRDFMDAALYAPEHGYYRRRRDPFGAHGDFFTAEQLQPIFGILIARMIGELVEELGGPGSCAVVELGSGRSEMAGALEAFRYVPVEIGGCLPGQIRGVVFSNEFFDALPVHAFEISGGVPRELLVGWKDGQFVWILGPAANEECAEHIRAFWPAAREGSRVELNLEARRWTDRIAQSLESGFALTIDYGLTSAESVRFPNGTLMSYRRHAALDEVLADPGERDITAHVHFTALEQHGRARGLVPVRFETLSQTLLRAGERDQFASVLEAESPAEQTRRRLQLKTLLFGMGETFRTLLQRREK